MRITSEQALAWRMKRNLLNPVGDRPTSEVAARLCGVQCQVPSTAELAIRLRQEKSRSGEVDEALAVGRLIKTWAMRGTLHLMTPESASAFLPLLASGRPWERASWQRHFDISISQMESLGEVVGDALDGRQLTRHELVEAVMARPQLHHLADALRSGWGTILKPLAWQGILCFGPRRNNRATFASPKDVSRDWPGLLPVEDAAPIAIAAYFRAHGPATFDAYTKWLAGGWFGKRKLLEWWRAFGDRLTEVHVDGESAYMLVEDAHDLASTPPTKSLRLLAGFDQYVLAPGTTDPRVVPPRRRAFVSRKSGWISPVIVYGGVVAGTWGIRDDTVQVLWFPERGPVPRGSLQEEISRLASILQDELKVELIKASNTRG